MCLLIRKSGLEAAVYLNICFSSKTTYRQSIQMIEFAHGSLKL